MPPLRQRRDDIPLLVETSVRRFAAAQGKTIASIPQPLMDELLSHEWPGYVRELSNLLEQAVITSAEGVLRLPSRLGARLPSKAVPSRDGPSGYRGTLQEVERDYIERVLEGCSWRIEGDGGGAERLGIHPNTLRHRMRKLDLRRPRASDPETEAGGRSGKDPSQPGLAGIP